MRLAAGIRGRCRDRKGQALAEMAIVLPVLLLLVFGIVEMSSAWRTFSVLTNAAREGARVAVVPSGSMAGVTERIENYLTAGSLDVGDAVITVQCLQADGQTMILDPGVCTGAGRTGTVARIRVDYPHTFSVLTPLIAWTCGAGCTSSFGTITIASTSTMRNE